MIEEIHTIFGFSSLSLGLYVLSQTKGTKRHKLIGKMYVVSMLGLNITAFGIYEIFNGFGIFHWAAIISLSTIVGGIVVIIFRKGIRNWVIVHYDLMVWSYIGLLAATSNEIFVHVDFFTELGGAYKWSPMVSMLLVFFVGGWWASRNKKQTTKFFLGKKQA